MGHTGCRKVAVDESLWEELVEFKPEEVAGLGSCFRPSGSRFSLELFKKLPDPARSIYRILEAFIVRRSSINLGAGMYRCPDGILPGFGMKILGRLL